MHLLQRGHVYGFRYNPAWVSTEMFIRLCFQHSSPVPEPAGVLWMVLLGRDESNRLFPIEGG